MGKVNMYGKKEYRKRLFHKCVGINFKWRKAQDVVVDTQEGEDFLHWKTNETVLTHSYPALLNLTQVKFYCNDIYILFY